MRRYLATLTLTVVIPFAVIWLFCAYGYQKFADTDYWLNKAHSDEIAKCDLGDVDVIGDSTPIADVIPSRIGPGVRDFGLNGGSPITAYYTARSILKCSRLPKAVVIFFVAGNLNSNPSRVSGPAAYYWKAVQLNVLDFSDALQVLKISRQFNDRAVVGPESLFDLDYRVEAFLYSIKFPAYYIGDLQSYAVDVLRRKPAVEQITGLTVYHQAVLDGGHHFLGTNADAGTALDSDVYRTGQLVSPIRGFYLRQTIEDLEKKGVAVYFVEPPRDRTSVVHYGPNLVNDYQNFLSALQLSEPNFHVMNGGFSAWDSTLFGDARHLNLRGAMILSADLREDLAQNGSGAEIYSDADLEPGNLYDSKTDDGVFWGASAQENGFAAGPATNIALPDLAYPGASPWLLKAAAKTGGVAASAIQAPPVDVRAGAHYAVSVFVKNVSAGQVGLRLNWPEGQAGSVDWDFKQHKITYSGSVSALNSGVTICPGGWVQLFISALTGPDGGSYAGPELTLSDANGASVYLYNMSVEQRVWPANYCLLQPDEGQTIMMPQNVQAESLKSALGKS